MPGLGPALIIAGPLARRFEASGHRLFLVGGAVRDAIMGRDRPGAELDCTTDAHPGVVKELVAPAASSVWTQGERFGTIGCVIAGQTYEITTYRTERYDEDSRKPAVAFGDDIAEDLARRDFTVNAIACDVSTGALVDPWGGCGDLAAAVLRTPLGPEVAFRDDPLRMLRAARFIADCVLTPDPGLEAAVRAMADRLDIVSAERIRAELERLLLLRAPEPGLRFLASSTVLDRVLPGLVGSDIELTSRAVTAVPATAPHRWAALLAGDPRSAPDRLRELRCSRALIDAAARYTSALTGLDPPPTGAPALRRAVHSSWVSADTVDFARAVRHARGESVGEIDAFVNELEELRAVENIDDLKVPLTGTEVMKLLDLGPGPEVGRALDHLRQLGFDRGQLSPVEARAELARWRSAMVGSARPF